MRYLFFSLFLSLVSHPGLFADDSDRWKEVTLSNSSFTLDAGKSAVLNLDGWRHVRKLYVEAQGATSSGGMMEIVVNNDVKGTIYVPGTDPTYVVTVEETAERVTFRHTSGGSIRVFSVKALQSDHPVPVTPPVSPAPTPQQGIASFLAHRSAQLVDTLRPFCDPATEYVQYLLPIKSTAGRAMAIASVHGDLSAKTRDAMLIVAKQIESADALISQLMRKDQTYQMAIDLLATKYAIYDKLN